MERMKLRMLQVDWVRMTEIYIRVSPCCNCERAYATKASGLEAKSRKTCEFVLVNVKFMAGACFPSFCQTFLVSTVYFSYCKPIVSRDWIAD